jgi:hypothetical protein
MLQGPYKDVYTRVYVFPPSCAKGIAPAWDGWRKHVKDYMKVPEEEQTMWSTWEPQVLEKLIKRHAKVNAHLKAQGKKKGYVICCLVDDFSQTRVKKSCTAQLTCSRLFLCGDAILGRFAGF